MGVGRGQGAMCRWNWYTQADGGGLGCIDGCCQEVAGKMQGGGEDIWQRCTMDALDVHTWLLLGYTITGVEM